MWVAGGQSPHPGFPALYGIPFLPKLSSGTLPALWQVENQPPATMSHVAGEPTLWYVENHALPPNQLPGGKGPKTWHSFQLRGMTMPREPRRMGPQRDHL